MPLWEYIRQKEQGNNVLEVICKRTPIQSVLADLYIIKCKVDCSRVT